MEPLVLESCHSTWVFDVERHRFCRTPRGSQLTGAHTAWQHYHALELDEHSDRFVVVLNEAGTRLLQSWRHVGRCDVCDRSATGELPRTPQAVLS